MNIWRNIFFSILTLYPLIITYTQDYKKYWIIVEKNGNLNFAAHELGITERALKRRAKSIPPNQLIDEFDYPIPSNLIEKIKSTGVKIRTISRWLSAISVEATPHQLGLLKSIQGVKDIEQVEKVVFLKPEYNEVIQSEQFKKRLNSTTLDYGYSLTQLANIKITDLHSMGINGKGVLICLIDDGFNNYRTHPALRNIDVIATYDFIHNITDVNRQPWEMSIQGNHGQGVLSSIGGLDNGKLIGAAYGASFLLAKTEMDSSGSNADFHSEEDTYVAALEWAERLGADIASSSLGYKNFSPPLYTTSDLNGRTTKVAQAAVIAARKGVLVVTAMGNEGYISGRGSQYFRADTTLVSPADADSILSVGATSSDGWLATFSGTGPTADGRIKPEVVAQGMGVYWAYGISDYISVNGTSASTPLVAGAAALILSAHPQLNNMQVRDAIMKTAVHLSRDPNETATYPNNYYGWGFLNAYDAAIYYGNITPIINKIYQNYPNPFCRSQFTNIKITFPEPTNVEVIVFNLLGEKIKVLFKGTVVTEKIIQWDGKNESGKYVASGVYFAHLRSSELITAIKMIFLN